MGSVGYHGTSVLNYHSTLRNVAEERRSQGTMFCQLVHLDWSDFKLCRTQSFKFQLLHNVDGDLNL